MVQSSREVVRKHPSSPRLSRPAEQRIAQQVMMRVHTIYYYIVRRVEAIVSDALSESRVSVMPAQTARHAFYAHVLATLAGEMTF